MPRDKLSHIVCAVRGVPRSRETATRAIDLALENDSKLTFVHVVNAEFLNHATVGPLSVVYNELVEMATFAMLILCDRAERRGVREAAYAIREGDVRQQLSAFAAEVQPQLMVIGQPSRPSRSSVFGNHEIETFKANLEENAGVRVFQVGSAEV
jgi:nucleotide-binding universal stress UspA family protein